MSAPRAGDTSAAGQALADLHTRGRLELPLPGSGRTMARFDGLAGIAAVDLSVGRLAEGHIAAVAILAEVGRPADPSACYGVWAARAPDAEVTASRRRDGWVLRGRKQFCSGAGTLSRALVTAQADDGYRLFEVPLDAPGVAPAPDSWPAVGMAASASVDVAFGDVEVTGSGALGPPGFYTGRPGFLFGAVGVAACWYGGAIGLMRGLLDHLSAPDEHQLAHLGAAAAQCASMQRTLAWAAARIDADPTDAAGRMASVALEARHLIESGCTEVLQRVGRAGGSRPLCLDADQSRRAADLFVYLRQHHGEQDMARLGRVVRETGPWS